MEEKSINYPKGGFPKLMYKIDNIDDSIKLSKKREFDNKNILSINTILNNRKVTNDESSLLFLKRAEKSNKKKKETSENIDIDIDTNQLKNQINLLDINKPINIKRSIKLKQKRKSRKSRKSKKSR